MRSRFATARTDLVSRVLCLFFASAAAVSSFALQVPLSVRLSGQSLTRNLNRICRPHLHRIEVPRFHRLDAPHLRPLAYCTSPFLPLIRSLTDNPHLQIDPILLCLSASSILLPYALAGG
jgi:hypothetical protein